MMLPWVISWWALSLSATRCELIRDITVSLSAISSWVVRELFPNWPWVSWSGSQPLQLGRNTAFGQHWTEPSRDVASPCSGVVRGGHGRLNRVTGPALARVTVGQSWSPPDAGTATASGPRPPETVGHGYPRAERMALGVDGVQKGG